MVVDTSALVAILLAEPNRAALLSKILAAPSIMPAPCVLEAHMVLSKYFGAATERIIESELGASRISVIAFTFDHAKVAQTAFELYGKGRHPAALNFGDCMSYAVAKLAGQPLLFTGTDFSKTDIKEA